MRISDWSSDVCSSDLAKKMEIAVARPLPRDRRRSLRQGVDGRNCAHARRPGDTACNASRHIADDMPIRSIRALRLSGTTAYRTSSYAEPSPRWRSDERRVGKGDVRTYRLPGATSHYKKNQHTPH